LVRILLNRTDVLREILNIESQIYTMRTDPTYLFIKRNLNQLETKGFGSHPSRRTRASIPSPDNPETILNIKYNSPEFNETLTRYKERLSEFDLQMNKLLILKANLQKTLFKDAK